MKIVPKDIAGRVAWVIHEHLGCDLSSITGAASLVDDLGADSLDAVELVLAFEEEFQFNISDDAAFEENRTVGDVIAFVTAQVEAHANQ